MPAPLETSVLAAIDSPEAIERAVAALARGELIGLPTETVYGLAADASEPEAVAKIFASKGRPAFNPLISHIASLEMARREGVFDERGLSLADAFWPGPLTLVVPCAASARSCELARAGLNTIGLRMPAHPVARAVLEAFDGPLSAPSANPSGRLSPTSADDVYSELGNTVALVLDGGPCEAGIESTIVSLLPDSPPRLLRPGAIAREAIEAIVGSLETAEPDRITAPGQLSSHYAPRAHLRLNATTKGDDEVLLGFGPDAVDCDLNLSLRADPVEAASNLFRMLRELDATGAKSIAVSAIPDQGLGEAINDRLRRAAAPRDDVRTG